MYKDLEQKKSICGINGFTLLSNLFLTISQFLYCFNLLGLIMIDYTAESRVYQENKTEYAVHSYDAGNAKNAELEC